MVPTGNFFPRDYYIPQGYILISCGSESWQRHRAEQRPAGEEGLEVSGDEIRHPTQGLRREHGPVSRQHDVVHGEQLRRHLRLVLVHVQPCAADDALPQAPHQLRLVHQAAAADVDEHAARAQRLHHAPVHHAPRLLRQRARQHQHVAGRREGARRRVELVGAPRLRRAGAVGDAAAEGGEAPRHQRADAAQPQDPHALAAHLEMKLRPCIVSKNFQSRFLITSNLASHAWSIKYRWKQKLITQFTCKSRDESFDTS